MRDVRCKAELEKYQLLKLTNLEKAKILICCPGARKRFQCWLKQRAQFCASLLRARKVNATFLMPEIPLPTKEPASNLQRSSQCCSFDPIMIFDSSNFSSNFNSKHATYV
uniref:Uncharacterized protein n=1 Tax=Spongospora subterranea TaxID=70186 RepID=A0A0H5QTT6_9EUKA|eukprot:CRZ05290.1 hypothetical protein [Spongospora subterranea]